MVSGDLVASGIRFDAVRAEYAASGGPTCVLRDLDLTVAPGEFVCLLGKTGCGKSTLLKLVLGELEPAAGEVRVAGRAISGPGKHCGYVPQKYSLFPDRRVIDNIAFGPRTERLHFCSFLTPEGRRRIGEINLLARRLVDRVGLSVRDGRKFPAELSGGMQQRVAIAQALATNPSLLLLDEAFSALDTVTRASMQVLIREIWMERKSTIMFVTHSTSEALCLGTRIIVLAKPPGSDAHAPASIRLDMRSPWGRELSVAERRQMREFGEMIEILEDATQGTLPESSAQLFTVEINA
jgi:NitT/TauT family transport system ATP-binding protein